MLTGQRNMWCAAVCNCNRRQVSSGHNALGKSLTTLLPWANGVTWNLVSSFQTWLFCEAWNCTLYPHSQRTVSTIQIQQAANPLHLYIWYLNGMSSANVWNFNGISNKNSGFIVFLASMFTFFAETQNRTSSTNLPQNSIGYIIGYTSSFSFSPLTPSLGWVVSSLNRSCILRSYVDLYSIIVFLCVSYSSVPRHAMVSEKHQNCGNWLVTSPWRVSPSCSNSQNTVCVKVHIIRVYGSLYERRRRASTRHSTTRWQRSSWRFCIDDHEHTSAFLVYVDDFLAAEPRPPSQSLLDQLLRLWKGSAPDFSEEKRGRCWCVKILGLRHRVGTRARGWYISKLHLCLLAWDVLWLSERKAHTRWTWDILSQTWKRDHAPILRLVGVLLWKSLRTRPDISWAVTRITRVDERQARICLRHVAQYLHWAPHLALFYEPVRRASWDCYADASWSPEGDYSHQTVALRYGTNLIAWQSQRQSLVSLSSAEAELIAAVWGNRLGLSWYRKLQEMTLTRPAYTIQCDNATVAQLSQQLSASKTRTRHVNVDESFLITTSFGSAWKCKVVCPDEPSTTLEWSWRLGLIQKQT